MSDTLDSSQSRLAKIVSFLETALKLTFAVGLRAALVASGLFLIYILAGAFVILFGWPTLSYPIFSLKADPFFVIGGTAVGLFFVQSSGSFVLYHMLTGIEDEKSQLAILLGFISLGFGGALLRVTLQQAIRFFNVCGLPHLAARLIFLA